MFDRVLIKSLRLRKTFMYLDVPETYVRRLEIGYIGFIPKKRTTEGFNERF